MRIVVDARQVFRPQRRGIGKTLINLYATLAVRRPAWHFLLLHQTEATVTQLEGLRNLTRSRIDFFGLNRFELWEQAILPMCALATRADILHSPANTGPKRSSVPVVVNIHDLIPYELAPETAEAQLWLFRVRQIAERAKHILTGSEYSKQRLMEVLNTPADKITVNPWAPDRNTRHITDPVELGVIRVKYGLHPAEPYAFGFGASDPRKNTAKLIRAYANLPTSVRATYRLLLVGIQDEALPQFRKQADEAGLGDRVVLHGFIEESDISGLLSGARLLCFPSRYEGFGLPILDAFVCRTPVLTGNRTSLPEVAGDAAVLLDPDDDDALRDGLLSLLTNEPLRQELIARGVVRSQLFTWERTADRVAKVFETVAKS